MLNLNEIYHCDCMDGMKDIDTGSVDLILIDPPYDVLQATSETWEKPWDMETFAYEANRILKDTGYFFCFGLLSFFCKFLPCTDKYFRVHFDLIWVKPNSINFTMCRVKPMNNHEQIVCLIKHNAKPKSMTYNYKDIGYLDKPSKRKGTRLQSRILITLPEQIDYSTDGYRYPKTVLYCYHKTTMPHSERVDHPTQKPLALLEWIVRGFTNENDVVLDAFLGSGSTAVACVNTKRNFIGFELMKDYYKIAQERIKQAQQQLSC